MITVPNTHPTLILIRGVPGSGKTYLANALQQALGADNVVTLDPDATDYTSPEYLELSASLTKEGVDAKFHPYRFVRGKAHKAIIDKKILIWNQPFTSLDGFEKTVRNLTAHAEENNVALPLLVVEVEIDADTAKKRVNERKAQGGHGPTEGGFARFLNDYASFADKGYTTVTVQGHHGVEASVASVVKALEALWQS